MHCHEHHALPDLAVLHERVQHMQRQVVREVRCLSTRRSAAASEDRHLEVVGLTHGRGPRPQAIA
eukprot:7566791-Pyramimonas_sp.AAC.1